jgi:hypothetical protein
VGVVTVILILKTGGWRKARLRERASAIFLFGNAIWKKIGDKPETFRHLIKPTQYQHDGGRCCRNDTHENRTSVAAV